MRAATRAAARTAVPLVGIGWWVTPRPRLGVVDLSVTVYGDVTLKHLPAAEARRLAEALLAAADELDGKEAS